MTVKIWEIEIQDSKGVLKEDLSEKWSSATMDDVTRELPTGAYTTFRTYNHHYVINIEIHLDRLEETASLAKKPILLQRSAIRRCIREALEISSNPNSRIRIFIDLSLQPGRIILFIEPLRIPAAECYERGVEVVTHKIVRDNPQAKLTNFISIAHQVRQSLDLWFEEILLVDKTDNILEGLTSNFFAIVGNRLRTADQGILLGITRSIVLKEAKQVGVEIQFKPISIQEIPEIPEAFITSSSRGILPIRSIDGAEIGAGNPGPYTRLLTKQFEEKISKLLKPI